MSSYELTAERYGGARTSIDRPEAVLWDLDGTLVDSAPLWRAAEFAFLASHGLAWDDRSSDLLVGGNLERVSAVVAEVTGVRFALEELRVGLVSRVEEMLAVEVPWVEGARELLQGIRAHSIPQALVTSSVKAVAEIIVATLPVATFDTMVTRESVLLPKPDPAPYLLALERLGVSAEFAIAVEDSPTGVASARGAGLSVLIVQQDQDSGRPSLAGLDLSLLTVGAKGLSAHSKGMPPRTPIDPRD